MPLREKHVVACIRQSTGSEELVHVERGNALEEKSAGSEDHQEKLYKTEDN